MSSFTFTVRCDNDAFGLDRHDMLSEVEACFQRAIKLLQDSPSAIAGRVRDTNGSSVGNVQFTCDL